MKIVTIHWKKRYTFTLLVGGLVFMLFYFALYTASKPAMSPAVEEDGIPLPILMYHSVLRSKTGTYILTPSELEKDLAYIQEQQYTPIVMADLISYVEQGTSLPEKPIMLTFDDGCYNNLTYVVPLLEQYHMRAIISIVGAYTDTYSASDEANPNYGYLRWKDISSLLESGTIEFQNHTYNLHATSPRKGCMKRKGESDEVYARVLTSDIKKLQEAFLTNTGYTPTTFTYPFGAISHASIPIIKELGFKASLSCAEGINYLHGNAEELYGLKRFNRSGSIDSARFFKKVGL